MTVELWMALAIIVAAVLYGFAWAVCQIAADDTTFSISSGTDGQSCPGDRESVGAASTRRDLAAFSDDDEAA